MKRFFNNLIRFFRRTISDDISLYAAQASFFIVFSFIPFLMLLIMIVRHVISVDITNLLNALNSYLPLQLYELVSQIITDVYFKSSSMGFISVTAITTLWLASKGILALYQGLNRILSPNIKTSFLRTRIASVLYTLVFIVALAITLLLFGFGNFIASIIPDHMQIFVRISKIILQWKIIILPLLSFIFALFYMVLPKEKNSLKKQLPGAVLAASGWLIFSYFYSIYVQYFSNYSYVYGSLAAVVLLMLWLYICMNIFLMGAELNELLEEGFFK